MIVLFSTIQDGYYLFLFKFHRRQNNFMLVSDEIVSMERTRACRSTERRKPLNHAKARWLSRVAPGLILDLGPFESNRSQESFSTRRRPKR